MKAVKGLLLVAGLVALCATAFGYDPGMHMYLGSKTLNFWSDYDSSFYQYLTMPDNNYWGMMTRKYYYIGLTIPDLLLPAQENIARTLVGMLYSHRSTGIDSALGQYYEGHFYGPMHIYDTTYKLLFVNDTTPIAISYGEHEEPLNSNLAKAAKMAEYARDSSGWAAPYKAMIYGCFMHMIQDYYCDCAAMPSRFGYGYVVDSDSALSSWILDYGEQYYELFSETHVDSSGWDFIERDLYRGQWVNTNPYTYGGYLQFISKYDVLGSHMPVEGWQDCYGDQIPVAKFAEAMNRYFDVQNLTEERLEAYLHGWGMLLFVMYGFGWNSGPVNIGGPAAHPDWSLPRVARFWDEIGDNFFFIHTVPGAVEDSLAHLLFGQFYTWAKPMLFEWTLSAPDTAHALMPYSFLKTLSEDYKWPEYWEGTLLRQQLYDSLPSQYKSPQTDTAFERMQRNLWFWEQYADVTPPNKRMSYDGEKDASLNIAPLMHNSLLDGASDLDTSFAVIELARKAGLTGGMFTVPDTDVDRQPGVLDCGFKFRGERVWAPIHPYANGDPQAASVAFDLACLNSARVNVEAKVDGERSEVNHNFLVSSSPQRWRDSVTFDLTQFGQATSCTLWYTIQTPEGSYWKTMLSSNYDSVYSAHPEICENTLYQHWYKSGDPTRSEAENPFTNPVAYWPYALLVEPVNGYYLSAPTALTCTLSRSGPLAAELNWADNSSYEYGYKIEKTVNHSSPTYIPSTGLLPANTTHYEDVNVAFGDTYRYRVWAERDNWESDTTPYAQIAITISSESLPPTAFNNQEKVAIRGNDVHMTYYTESQGVMYVHSSDGGKTWDQPERVDLGCYEYAAAEGASPAIALDSAGNPYILWPGIWWRSQGGEPWYMSYFVSSRNQYGQWSNDSSPALALTFGFNYPNSSNPPQLSPPAASFRIWHDSGCAALNYPGKDSVNPRNPGTYFAQFMIKAHSRQGVGVLDSIAPYSNASKPTMLVDAAGREVVISTYAGIDDDSVIRISYMDPNQSSFSHQDQYNGHVCNLTGALEGGSNVLLAWVNGGDSLQFGRFVKGTTGYTADPGVEMVSDVNIDYDYTRPKFVANYLGLPMLVYEYGPMWRGGIWYALRQKPGCWSVDTVFTPACYVSYPQGFCAGSRLRVFASGSDACYWPPYYLLSGSVMLPWYQFPSTSNAHATWPNSGRKLVVEPEGEGVHVVYDAGDSVLYVVSRDGGETWAAPSKIDHGNYPSIALDAAGLPTIVYERNDTVFCKMRRADSTWKAMTLYCGSATLPPGPPAAGRSLGSTAGYSYCAFPAYNVSQTRRSKVGLVKIDTILGNQTQWVGETTSVPIDSFVSIACPTNGPVSVAWQRVNRVMCATFNTGMPPSLEQVSNRPSSHPFIETYGGLVYLVWRDLQSGCLYMTSRQVGGIWDVVAIGADSADYPVNSKGLATAYVRPDTNAVDDIWAQVPGFVHNLSESPNVSSENPHLDVEIDSTQVVDTIYSIWTENVGQSLYAVRFRKLGVQRQTLEGVMALTKPLPLEPMLYNAEPCPSRGRTVLRYQVPRPEHVTLKIYDASGRSVRTVLDSERPAGVYSLLWDGRDQRGRVSPNGIYFCTMKAGDYKSGKKLIITR